VIDTRPQIRVRTTPRHQRGVSLLESLAAATIAALLAAAALPSLAHMLQRQQLALAVGDFMAAVELARATARNAQTRTGVEPLQAGRWESGWRVYADRNANGALDAGEAVLREFAPAAAGTAVSAHFGTYRATVLSFDTLGNLRRPGSGGFVLGRMVFRQDTQVHAVCFSALQVRTVASAQCPS
jgi:prepilin-type N-terminal cleavage/methylation domain-containing protein